MSELLNEYGTLGNRELRDKLGDANVTSHSSNSAGTIHYYELESVNGEPRYRPYNDEQSI